MDTKVTLAVLLAAVLHAVWNAIVKHSQERWLTFAAVIGVGGLAFLPVTPFVTPPAPESWPFIALSGVIHLVYYWALLTAYGYGDLGHVYPVARGSAPLIVALAAVPLAGELPGTPSALGIVAVSLGVLLLAHGGAWRATLAALLTGACIAAYTVSDGLGARRSGSVLGYVAWLHVVIGVPFCSAVFWLKRGQLSAFARAQGLRAALGGVIATGAYSIAIWAMNRAQLALVASLRETSVIVAALIGTYSLGERFGTRRVLAACVVASGIVLMSLP